MIGVILRKIRKQKGLSLRELAKLSGLSHSFISDIENGRCNPSIKSLLKITNALDVNPNIFLTDVVAENDRNQKENVRAEKTA